MEVRGDAIATNSTFLMKLKLGAHFTWQDEASPIPNNPARDDELLLLLLLLLEPSNCELFVVEVELSLLLLEDADWFGFDAWSELLLFVCALYCANRCFRFIAFVL